MKQLVGLLFTLLVMASCGTDSHHFKFEGRFKHLNQGEFYVYSPDGAIDGMDTVKVRDGRFAYEMVCESPATLMLVFPNFSQQPVFAVPGEAVEISGDASHLKLLKVKGTDDNELMNGFREQVNNASPPEMQQYASQFIKDHPKSRVCAYLLNEYFLREPRADYRQADTLLQFLLKHQPENNALLRLTGLVKPRAQVRVGGSLPAFADTDVYGRRVTSADLLKAEVGVLTVWATWSYDSQDLQRQIRELQKEHPGRLSVVSISVDASRRECRKTLHLDSVGWPTICDEEMLNGPLMRKLGFSQVPSNVVLLRGRIVALNLSRTEIIEKLKSLL